MFQRDQRLNDAYAYCRQIALGHYENFPVASILIPGRLRPHIFALYAFMRTADDFVDLPHRSSEERLQLLSDWRGQLMDAMNDVVPHHPIFLALQTTMRTFDLDYGLLHLLLDAFEFDARGNVHFDSYDDLHWYTKRSAEPVGQLVLALFGYKDSERIEWSNDICTALQLINFLQDAQDDLKNGRCYFPREDYEQFDISSYNELSTAACGDELIRFECERINKLLDSGKQLPQSVDGRLRWELRATLGGANIMLKKIRRMGAEVFWQRPKLSALEKSQILFAGRGY